MANRKPNPFAQDFQSIKESADDAVMQFLKHGQQNETPKEKATPKIVEISASPDPEAVIVKSGEKTENESVEEKADRKNRSRAEKSEKTATPKERVSAKPKEWGRPTALFNTRIPQEMSDLLDDLVYRLKKEGKPHTKQTIAIEALDAYLQKSGLITKNAINLEGSVYPTA
jgi:hypothetical protein